MWNLLLVGKLFPLSVCPFEEKVKIGQSYLLLSFNLFLLGLLECPHNPPIMSSSWSSKKKRKQASSISLMTLSKAFFQPFIQILSKQCPYEKCSKFPWDLWKLSLRKQAMISRTMSCIIKRESIFLSYGQQSCSFIKQLTRFTVVRLAGARLTETGLQSESDT